MSWQSASPEPVLSGANSKSKDSVTKAKEGGEDEGLNCKSKLLSQGKLANTLLLSLPVCMAHKIIFATTLCPP